MSKDEKIFADGFSFKRQENAPEFVIGRLSMKVEEAIAFMRKHEKSGWINLNLKTGRSGNPYVELDTFEPKGRSTQEEPSISLKSGKKTTKKDDDGGLPF